MSEYFVRLATLLGTDFPEKLPVLGYIAKNVGVRQWRETWNDNAVVTTAEAVLDAAIAWEKGGFKFSVGNTVDEETIFRLEVASDRNSILTSLGDTVLESNDITDSPPREGLQILARADGPPAASRIQLHDLDLRIQLPLSCAVKGEIKNGNQIVPLDPPQPVVIAFLKGTLIIEPDAPRPIQFVLDDDEAVTIDPIYLPDAGVGIEVLNLKLDMSETSGIPEVLARPGFDETWTGLYIERFRIFGMNMFFPTLPSQVIDSQAPPPDLLVELSQVVIGFDDGGVSGSLKMRIQAPPTNDAFLHGGGFVVELERGHMIRCEVEVTLLLDRITDHNGTTPLEHTLQIVGSARFSADNRTSWELALNTPGTASEGLFSVGQAATAVLESVLASLLLIDAARNNEYTDAVLIVGLFTLLIAFEGTGKIVVNKLTLEALKLRYREELLAGRILKVIDFIIDVEVRLTLDIRLSEIPILGHALPDIRTDPKHPIGLLMKGFRLSYAYNLDEFDDNVTGGVSAVSLAWPTDFFFDFDGQTVIQGSPIVLTKFGFGRWDKGVWIDLGLKYAKNSAASAYSVMPAVVRIYCLMNGDIDHVTFEGVSLSILIPGVMFVRGRLNLGDDITEAALQGWFVSSPGLAKTSYDRRENWYWDVGAQYRKAELADGTDSTMVFAWLKTSTGVPIPFLPATALYGGHFLYADNARPALGGDTIERWYTDHEPKNQIEIDKWEGAPDTTGFGVGLVLGSQVDRGRPWNLQVGVLYADSQWLLHGYLNIFKQRPDPADTSQGSLRLLGGWGPGRLFASVRWVEQVPADGKVMKIDLGADLVVDDANDQSHFYAGFHWPPERHLKAILFERYEVSFYLMQDDADVENFAGTGLTLPGFVAALGARFSIEGGRKKGRLKLYFYFRASADLAFAGSDPMLTVVRASVAGGIVAKAYGMGFELEAAAEFLWVRPQPDILTGKIKITLDLPWPIPNLHYTLDVSDGTDGPTEDLLQLIEGLTLISRVPNGVVELEGGSQQPPVPVDPVFELAFSYPTRNGSAVDGNFQITAAGLNAVDTQVTHETSGGNAYAIELTALRLWRGGAGPGTLHPGPIPAKWIKQQTEAPGGQPSRRVLELFSLEDVALSRLVGPTLELVGDMTDGWNPCPPPTPPQPICYFWNDQPLGTMDRRAALHSGTAPAISASMLDEPEGAESMRRFFGWTALATTVVPFTLISSIFRALQLPAVEGPRLPDTPAAPALELRFAVAHNVLLDMARPPRARRVVVRFYMGDRLVKEDTEGLTVPGLEGRWEHVFYTCDGPLDRAVIETMLQGNPEQDDASALLLRVCIVLESEFRQFQDAVASGTAWADFWNTFSISDPLVLQPASHYTLEVEGRWARVKDGLETPGGAFHRTFEFDTVGPDDWPRQLRGVEQSVDGKSGYDVKTTPAAGAVAVYRQRPVRVEFRHRRIELVYAAFGRRLAIRLMDDEGNADIRWLEYTPQAVGDLPDSDLAWRDVVTSSSCTTGDLDWHWHFPVVTLTDVLEAGRRYDASIYALDGGITDLAVVDLKSEPVIYQFTFRTSQFPTFADHVKALTGRGALDEVVAGQAPLAHIAQSLGGSPRVVDDALLAATLTDRLGLPRRESPPEPELVRVWQRTAAGDELVALLLDGPEPLPRPGDGSLELRTSASVLIDTVLLQGASGTRTLVFFGDGSSGLKTMAPLDLQLIARDAWVAGDASPQVDAATLAIPVPPRPAFLDPEGPP